MEKYKSLFMPGAVLGAGALIAVSVFATGGLNIPVQEDLGEEINDNTVLAAPPVAADDYILGNPDAPITLIEYSDLECPFCKRFHPTAQQALAEYGDQVRWVYKHFPIDQIHSKADKEAEASECAGELGGNEAFWAYIDRVFEITPSNNGLDLNLLPQIAGEIGLDRVAFESCLNSGRYAEKVERQYQEGVRFGVTGTPGSFVNGTPVRGALPYENLKAIIDAELQKLESR